MILDTQFFTLEWTLRNLGCLDQGLLPTSRFPTLCILAGGGSTSHSRSWKPSFLSSLAIKHREVIYTWPIRQIFPGLGPGSRGAENLGYWPASRIQCSGCKQWHSSVTSCCLWSPCWRSWVLGVIMRLCPKPSCSCSFSEAGSTRVPKSSVIVLHTVT